MRTLLLLSLLVTGVAAFAQSPAPTPATPAPKPAPTQTAPPDKPKPTPRRRAAPPAARSGITMVVSDENGMPLDGVHVELTGPAMRTGDTNSAGQLNVPGLDAGTYRLRFTADSVTAFEREVTLRPGAIEHVTITLSPPPAPREAPKPEAPPAPAVGPKGAPQIGSLTNLADRERKSNEPRHEVLLSCSGDTRNVLLVLNADQPDRIYQSAEATFYVLSGQGGAHVGSLQSAIGPGSFVAVPRGTSFSIGRQGKSPLVMLWTLSGEPCEQAR